MHTVFANRNKRGDFVINEFERAANDGKAVYIASAFFTDASIVERLLSKGCDVFMVVRLGFPTDPSAIDRVMKDERVRLRVYTSRHFHPKLYIFGDESALVGSANLTRSAVQTNQEVMVKIEGRDERFAELMNVFDDYWANADVLTAEQLDLYRELYKQYAKHEYAIAALEDKAAATVGDTSPDNIDRSKPKATKSSVFLSTYRRAYQESIAAFDVIRNAYRESGYRKVSEEAVPLRLEVDSFISFVRERHAQHDRWLDSPIRTAVEQKQFIRPLIDEWKQTYWEHFEKTIAEVNYPRLRTVFHSPESIMAATDAQLFDALATLHSFHDRFRFFLGGLPTWKNEFPRMNEPRRTRETIAYLVHGSGDVVERMANAIYSSQYKLNEFGQSNVQELIGWFNREDLPIINGRTTKVLRYFGSNVRQL